MIIEFWLYLLNQDNTAICNFDSVYLKEKTHFFFQVFKKKKSILNDYLSKNIIIQTHNWSLECVG